MKTEAEIKTEIKKLQDYYKTVDCQDEDCLMVLARIEMLKWVLNRR